MNDELVKFENESEMSEKAVNYAERVDKLSITSRKTYDEMLVLVRDSKQFQDSITRFFEPMRLKTYEAYNEVLKQKKKHIDPFLTAEKLGKNRMRVWDRVEAERQMKAQRAAMEKAHKAEEEGKPVIVPVVENKARAAKGVTYVDDYKGEIVDMKLFCKSIIAGKATVDMVVANYPILNKFAKATAGKVAIPGVRWTNERIVKIGK